MQYTLEAFEQWLAETFPGQETFRENNQRFEVICPFFRDVSHSGPVVIDYWVTERILLLGIHPKDLEGKVDKLEYYHYCGLCLWKGVKIKDLIEAVRQLHRKSS